MAFALVAGATVCATRVYHRVLSDTQRQTLDRWQRFSGLGNKIKIMIGFYVIATKVDDVYEGALLGLNPRPQTVAQV